MGAGHHHLNKSLRMETQWLADTERHKHQFIEPYILEEKNKDGRVWFYRVMKCNKCISFKSVPKKNNVSGFISELSEEDKALPKIIGLKTDTTRLGFCFIEKVYLESKSNEIYTRRNNYK